MASAHRAEPDPPAPPSGREEPFSTEELKILLRVAGILRTIRFGTVLIVVQDGKVVQIEMAEKLRLR